MLEKKALNLFKGHQFQFFTIYSLEVALIAYLMLLKLKVLYRHFLLEFGIFMMLDLHLFELLVHLE